VGEKEDTKLNINEEYLSPFFISDRNKVYFYISAIIKLIFSLFSLFLIEDIKKYLLVPLTRQKVL